MNILNKYLSITIGFSSLLIAIPSAHSTTITFLDTTEGLQVLINGNICLPLGTPEAPCTTTTDVSKDADFFLAGDEKALSKVFTSFDLLPITAGTFAVVLTEPISGSISDILKATVTVSDTNPARQETFFEFISDPLASSEINDPLVQAIISGGFGIRETGNIQNLTTKFRDAAGMSRSIPNDLIVNVASDVGCDPDRAFVPKISIFAFLSNIVKSAFIAPVYAQTSPPVCRVPEPSSNLGMLVISAFSLLSAGSAIKCKWTKEN